MVRLQPAAASSTFPTTTAFNPTMVRLQPKLLEQWAAEVAAFNPTMVRLQLTREEALERWRKSFNPTMVRLQLRKLMKILGLDVLSIPLWCDCNLHSHSTHYRSQTSFNPTMVRLQRRRVGKAKPMDGTFNPTMVRLQPGTAMLPASLTAMLSIPLWCDCNHQQIPCTQTQMHPFNPTMVRLQHGNDGHGCGYERLSIPLWCDCNRAFSSPWESPKLLSIPLWCDCNYICGGGEDEDEPLFQSHYGAIATARP